MLMKALVSGEAAAKFSTYLQKFSRALNREEGDRGNLSGSRSILPPIDLYGSNFLCMCVFRTSLGKGECRRFGVMLQ